MLEKSFENNNKTNFNKAELGKKSKIKLSILPNTEISIDEKDESGLYNKSKSSKEILK